MSIDWTLHGAIHTTLIGDCHLYTYRAMLCYTVEALLWPKGMNEIDALHCLLYRHRCLMRKLCVRSSCMVYRQIDSIMQLIDGPLYCMVSQYGQGLYSANYVRRLILDHICDYIQ